ncbi:MAG: transglycosylase SLT domain-containing protein, partial [Asticcacaulis sp.]
QLTPSPGVPSRAAYTGGLLSAQDGETLRGVLAAAKSRNSSRAEALRQSLSDPLAKKIALWAMIDNGLAPQSFIELDGARRDLWDWPRANRRQVAAESLLATSGLSDARIVDWFQGSPPETFDGMMALAAAHERLGQSAKTRELVRHWWRTALLDLEPQTRLRAQYGQYLTAEDHAARLDSLLLGPQGPAAREMLSLVGAEHRQVAEAVMALRGRSAQANSLFGAVEGLTGRYPVLAFERARFLRASNLETLAYPLLNQFPPAPAHEAGQRLLWEERLSFFRRAYRNKDFSAAYAAMNGASFPAGERRAESAFFAGWVALTRLNRPADALRHFEEIRIAGSTGITQSRAHYWLGRSYEALGDAEKAQAHFQQGGQHMFAFYGQLAAEKAGIKTLTLGKDPIPGPADKARFEARESVRAIRILADIGELPLARTFMLAVDDILPNAEEAALLVDLAAQLDGQDTAMRIARVAMQRGLYLPERAYPLRDIPAVKGPEPAFVLAITRQESGFDPRVRSHANARGMMQLIPPTARAVAKRMGYSYSDEKLWDPTFNMSLGSYHLQELVEQYNGSYVMTAAGYNAGPNRPPRWREECADPRGDKSDAIVFIECAPFTETRNYMMRVMENLNVYRARLNGGSAPLTPAAVISRGERDMPTGPRPYLSSGS